MKNKLINKSLKGKTGKDLLSLVNAKVKNPDKLSMLPPEGEVEISLFNFWESLLGHNSFGVKDDFFETGGNSIKVIQLLSRISSHFGVQLEPTDIFMQPTISQIASLILKLKKKNGIHIQPAIPVVEKSERPDMIPLSFSQERLWFINQLEGSLQYHVPAVLRLKGKLDKDALEYSLCQIINRHEILRTVIREKEGQGYQFIKNADEWKLSIADGSIYKDDKEKLQNYIQHLINKPFDLTEDYMLRADLISKDEFDHLLVVTMHHIASDAWSMSIIVREAIEFYESYFENRPVNLQPLPLQYADYAVWQRKHLNAEKLNTKLEYWKKKLDGAEPLNLSADFSRPSVRDVTGAEEFFIYDKELSDELKNLCSQYGTTLFMTLLAAFKVLMNRYSGQQDITIGTSVVNRPQETVENLVGFFVNTLAFRSTVNSEVSFADLLKDVKQTTQEAYGHQDVPFEKVVDAVVKERDSGRTPLFQVMLVMNNAPDVTGLRLGEIELSNVVEFENNILIINLFALFNKICYLTF